MLNGCGVYVPRAFSSFSNIPGSAGGQSEAPTTQQTRADGLMFRLSAEEDNKAEEKQALRARLFSRLCVNRLRGSTCRAVSDKVGGYQSGRLWATLSTHWRVQPVWNHMSGLLFVQASQKCEHLLTFFKYSSSAMLHETCVCIKNDWKSMWINQETALTLHQPLIFHRLWILSQHVLI